MSDLTTAEMNALTFMVEEEKLAFDVYSALAKVWDLKIFTNIANNSETKHIASIETLAEQYGITVPDLPTGVYENDELQSLYDNLVAIGSRSITDALKVGIVIEVVDIEDLNHYLTDTTNTDLTATFSKLLTDSEKHLDSFIKNLEKNGDSLAMETALTWLENELANLPNAETIADTLFNATLGKDSIVGTEALNDTLSYEQAASRGVSVNLSITKAQNTGGSSIDTIVGIENLVGSVFGDNLTGNAGNNKLSGLSGNDVLTGGVGADQLTGGEGRDKFVFKSINDSGLTADTMDVVTDFTQGLDKIDLSAIDANTATLFNNRFTNLITEGNDFTQAGQLKFEDGILYGNTDKDVEAEFAIALTGISTLSMTDIIA